MSDGALSEWLDMFESMRKDIAYKLDYEWRRGYVIESYDDFYNENGWSVELGIDKAIPWNELVERVQILDPYDYPESLLFWMVLILDDPGEQFMEIPIPVDYAQWTEEDPPYSASNKDLVKKYLESYGMEIPRTSKLYSFIAKNIDPNIDPKVDVSDTIRTVAELLYAYKAGGVLLRTSAERKKNEERKRKELEETERERKENEERKRKELEETERERKEREEAERKRKENEETERKEREEAERKRKESEERERKEREERERKEREDAERKQKEREQRERKQKEKEEAKLRKLAELREARRRLREATRAAEEAAKVGAALVFLPTSTSTVPKPPGRNTVLVRPSDEGTYRAVRKLLANVIPSDLAKGADQMEPGSYKSLRPVGVYDIDYSYAKGRIAAYDGWREKLLDEMELSKRCGNPRYEECVRTDQALQGVDLDSGNSGRKLGPLNAEANEKLLLHGTNPIATELIVKGNFSRGFASRQMYGPGIYMAEDPAKNDQYNTSYHAPYGGRPDRGIPHRIPTTAERAAADVFAMRLGLSTRVPTFYIIVSRTLLGCAAHARGGNSDGNDQENLRDKERVYNPAGDFHAGGLHSLVVEHGSIIGDRRDSGARQGARFREFIIPSEAQTLPLFLIAYTRDQQPARNADYRRLDCM